MSKSNELKTVTAYTDGSCLGNPGPGGWAALLIYRGREKMLQGQAKETTNNQMELIAVIEALKALKQPCVVELHTDSKYVMDGATKWLSGWKNKGWKNSQSKPVKNMSLWQALDSELKKHTVNWHWVKGHSGDLGNERVDDVARQAAEEMR